MNIYLFRVAAAKFESLLKEINNNEPEEDVSDEGDEINDAEDEGDELAKARRDSLAGVEISNEMREKYGGLIDGASEVVDDIEHGGQKIVDGKGNQWKGNKVTLDAPEPACSEVPGNGEETHGEEGDFEKVDQEEGAYEGKVDDEGDKGDYEGDEGDYEGDEGDYEGDEESEEEKTEWEIRRDQKYMGKRPFFVAC
jgi:hypothetical protein